MILTLDEDLEGLANEAAKALAEGQDLAEERKGKLYCLDSCLKNK